MRPDVRAGRRRHLVTLANLGGAVPDGDGGYTETATPLSPPTVWATITPATEKDLERAGTGTVLSTASHIVSMRYHSGVTTKTRITFGSRTLNVTGVANPDERNIELVLVAVEVVA
jgi:SPP1 family predicted phage head-tail adaptor